MSKQNSKMAFTRKNYTFMLIGLAVLFLGFFIMTQDKETYGFGILGITIGPLTVLAGFIIQFFAILYRPKKDK